MEHLERGDGGVRSWLSFKTHPLPKLVEWWVASGRGVEVVSETEFTTVRRLGCLPDQILVNGAGQARLAGPLIPSRGCGFISIHPASWRPCCHSRSVADGASACAFMLPASATHAIRGLVAHSA